MTAPFRNLISKPGFHVRYVIPFFVDSPVAVVSDLWSKAGLSIVTTKLALEYLG
jgi:hypothetical protein